MSIRTRRTVLFVLVSALLLSLLACSARVPIRGQESKGLDRKLSTFAFIEEGDIAAVIVDTRATHFRDKTPYIPLEICIANKGLKQLALTRESFILIDSEGNRYPAASPKELIEGYEFLDLDRNALAELEAIIFNKFAAFTRYGSRFSPNRQANPFSSNIVRDLVVLPKFGYLLDFIYFQAPVTGVKGKRFELFVESPDLPDPVFVKFVVE